MKCRVSNLLLAAVACLSALSTTFSFAPVAVSKQHVTKSATGSMTFAVVKSNIAATTTKTTGSSSSSSILSASTTDNDDSPSFGFNPVAGGAWVALVAWAFSSLAPGSLGSPEDTQMLNNIMANPVHPAGMNELYYLLFNMFAVVPIFLACLANPQGQPNKGLPALPFLVASSAIGYFGLGPYLTFRAAPREEIDDADELSWFTKTILENKLFAWGTVAFTLYLPFAVDLLGAYQADPAGLLAGFVDTISSSRFAAVSGVDITMLYVCAVALTPRDYMLRNPNATPQDAQTVALLSGLLPFLGTALYIATRPSLPVLAKDE